MAVMYSKLGGCFGETVKLGPLANTDLCALVKGLLDRLITHFGLGSSMEEEPWGLSCLLGREEALLPGKYRPGKMPPGRPRYLACLPRGIIRGITCLRIVTGESL